MMKPHEHHAFSKDDLDGSMHPVWLRVGRMLDAPRRRCVLNAHIVYDTNGFLYVGESPPPAQLIGDRTAIEMPDVLALPPLFDAHTHINLCGSELDADKRKAAQAQSPDQLLAEAGIRAAAILRKGVVAMRDGGDKDGVGLSLAKTTREHPARMARVFSPGPGIHRKGRYGSFFSRPVEEYASEAECVEARARGGADHIKIVPTGIINFAKGAVTAPPQFSAEEIRAFKRAATSAKRSLMAHASGEKGIGCALEGGVDTLEHGYFVSKTQLAIMRDQGILWVPTFAPVHRQVVHADRMGWNQAILDSLRRILDCHAKSIDIALESGVEILAGSDAGSYGVPHVTGLFEEIWLLSQAGMPAMEALCRAVHDNAARLAPNLVSREIAVNREATCLLAPQNVLHDARDLIHSSMIHNGCLVEAPNETHLF
jgi:imidazolonepropionase-like amidohydrolase